MAAQLTAETQQIVKSTAPILKEQGDAVTARMYELMFQTHPELKALFVNAPNNQNEILARAIISYSENIDNLPALEGALDKIAIHHINTNVKAEHYPIVEECLMQALKDVIGEKIITDEIIDAWKKAYWFLSDILIEREKALYAKMA
jgi:hemoglobin-like flavoprotein